MTKDFETHEHHGESKDQYDEELETGYAEEEVYDEEGREKLLEGDELNSWEEAFMEGAEDKGELGECAQCGKVLTQKHKSVVEREIDGELYWFCSAVCADKGPKE